MTWQAVVVILFAVAWTQTSTISPPVEGSPSAQVKTSCSSESFNENYRVGEKFLSEEEAALAVPYLEKAQQLCPSNYPAGRDLVIAYGKAGLPQKARTVAEGMLRQGDVAELHSLLGELYAAGGDLRSAAEQYQVAARLDPSEDNIFAFGSSVLKFEGDSALRIFRFGVEKYPASEKMHLGLGSALYGQGLVDEAVGEAYKASQLNPTDPKAMELLGQMAHIPAGMSPAIIERFSALCALYPHNARLTYFYAMALSGRWSDEPAADPARIVELLKAAAELDPSFAEAHFQLGELFQEQGRSLDAIQSYREAVKLEPKNESYHYRLALAYKKCGHVEESRREMQIYQKLHRGAK